MVDGYPMKPLSFWLEHLRIAKEKADNLQGVLQYTTGVRPKYLHQLKRLPARRRLRATNLYYRNIRHRVRVYRKLKKLRARILYFEQRISVLEKRTKWDIILKS